LDIACLDKRLYDVTFAHRFFCTEMRSRVLRGLRFLSAPALHCSRSKPSPVTVSEKTLKTYAKSERSPESLQ